jgi:S1-C subfamily serine protease
MKKIRHLFSLLAVLIFALLFYGSAVQKDLLITDGSRADGTLTLSYEYGAFEQPKLNMENAQQKIIDKCKAWGYSGADFFEAGERHCLSYDAYGGCNRWKVIHKAQCIFEPVQVVKTSNEPDVFSGTGIIISRDGIIVTNQHLIDGSVQILIKGVNGDFTKSYLGKVLIEDKQNDLALVKIDDNNFSPIDSIPFIIYDKSKNVGSNVFCLGYPLRATMGDEIKLTNGIISSKTGYQGDISSYQLTVAVQPGNSGAPLFDDNGYLIGIINAKHIDAENASYAKKSTFLLSLIDIISNKIDLGNKTNLNNAPFPQQVQILKEYVYIIEVTK